MCNNFAITVQKEMHNIPRFRRDVGIDIKKRFTFMDSGFISYKHGAMTENASTCSILNINLDNNNCLLHLAPEKYQDKRGFFNVNDILKNLGDIMEKVYEKAGASRSEPTAVITGGRWINEKDAKSLQSTDFMNQLAMFFEKHDIPLSIIFGKKNPEALDNAYIYNRNLTIWNNSLTGTKPQNNPTKEQVEDAIRESYEYVEIAPEHKIDFVIE